MKKFYFAIILSLLISASSKSQGVSSSYLIDSVVFFESYDEISSPISEPHYSGVDSFDVNGLIRSSYVIYNSSLNFAKHRTIYKYSITNKLLSEISEETLNGIWEKTIVTIIKYDSLDRKSDFSTNYFSFSNGLINPDSAVSHYGYSEHYEYNFQNLRTLTEYRSYSNNVAGSGSKCTSVFDSLGRVIEEKSEGWNPQFGYNLYSINNYEYNNNDSLSISYRAEYNGNSVSHKSKVDYSYDNAGYLKQTTESNYNFGSQTYNLLSHAFYYYDSQHRKIKTETPNSKRDVYDFNANGYLNWFTKNYMEDSIWYQSDSVHFKYNSRNQITERSSQSGGGSYVTYGYDSSGFNNYYEFSYCSLMGECNEGKSYISYKKLLHPNAIPQEDSFTIFPNPSNGNFNIIYYSTTDEPLTVRVYNAIGQTVFENTSNKTAGYFSESFDLEKLSNGIYLFEITSASKHSTKKIFIQ